MDDRNSVYAAALAYMAAGVYVNPVYVKRLPNGKKDVRPVGLWRTTSSISPADAYAWWVQEHPEAGILIDCGKSGLVAVDCDGEEGIANWLALDPPEPVGVAGTPGGGQHWLYAAHPDHVIGNDQSGKVAPKVDVRGLGGILIAAPSHDGSGGWFWAIEPRWDEARAVVPNVVIERMKAKAAPAASTGSPNDDDLFDSPAREFTRTQATDYIEAAIARLEQAKPGGLNGAINNFALECAHFPWLVHRDLCATLVIRHLGALHGWTEPDSSDIKTINSAYAATEAGRSWVATEVEAITGFTPVATGIGSPAKGEGEPTPAVLAPPSRPLDVARELLGWIPADGGRPHRAWWRDDFYRWTGAHWEVWDTPEVERWLYAQTGDAVYLAPPRKEGEDPVRTPWAPTRRKIGDLAHALGVGVLQRMGDEDRVLAAANGVIERRELLPHSPERFNLFSLPFDYDPAATAPAWQAFLDQVLPGDDEAQAFLAEWFGYVISGRTDQQKMVALVGEKRSGKGTIARVLTALVGKQNVAGLNLGLLAGTFGLEPFVGAALAVASDVRWHSRNIGDAVPILLEVSGEDHQTVHRKNRAAWKGRMGVRFMLMSNDTPTFSDRSGALVDRMLYVSFRESFLGREDVGLTDKLMHELPGILNWSLDGLDRLDSRGRFTQPTSGQHEVDATRRLADPIGTFIEDWCEIGPQQSISLDHLFLKYQNWCVSEGRTRDSTTKEIFSRDLRSKVKNLQVDRLRVEGKRTRILKGIGSTAV